MAHNFFLEEALRMRATLFYEDLVFGVFSDLEALGDEELMYTLYFKECFRLLELATKDLDRLPHISPDVEMVLSRIKHGSVSVGAIKVYRAITNLEECLRRQNSLQCVIAFGRIKENLQFLKNNLETYFELRYRSPPV